MKYPRILSALRSAKWAVTPSTLQAIRDTLSARMQGHIALPLRRAELDMGGDDGPMQAAPFEMIAPGVAAVRMHGIIGKNLSQMDTDCGGCDVGAVQQNLTMALASAGVGAVVLDIDSPGGTVSGVQEFATKIEQLSAASGKPVVAYIDGQGCSAAYWIACGCSAIYASPSADVGSIGVYMALVDESENWAKEGYKLVLIKAGDFKAAGIAGSQVTAEQMAVWQSDVDYIYATFTAAVKAARPSVADATMQGQVFYGARALEAGLVDAIAPDLESLAAQIYAPKAAPVAAS